MVIIKGGVISKVKKLLVKVEPSVLKPSGGSKLTKKRMEHQTKCKERKVSFVLPDSQRRSLQKKTLQVFKVEKEKSNSQAPVRRESEILGTPHAEGVQRSRLIVCLNQFSILDRIWVAFLICIGLGLRACLSAKQCGYIFLT